MSASDGSRFGSPLVPSRVHWVRPDDFGERHAANRSETSHRVPDRNRAYECTFDASNHYRITSLQRLSRGPEPDHISRAAENSPEPGSPRRQRTRRHHLEMKSLREKSVERRYENVTPLWSTAKYILQANMTEGWGKSWMPSTAWPMSCSEAGGIPTVMPVSLRI
jgi:hypothetical protein